MSTKELLTPEDALNKLKEYFRSKAHGRYRVWERRWNNTLGRWVLVAMNPQEFAAYYRNHLVMTGPDETESLGTWWLNHIKARTFDDIEFDPNPQRKQSPFTFNMFQGWPQTPNKEAPWPAIERHFRVVLANDDDKLYEYLLDWFAWLIQRPHIPSEHILAIRGVEGTGKTSMGELGNKLVGQHYFHASHAKHLLGHFNQHLEDVILVFSDEAVWSGDRQGLPTLKSLATDSTITIEAKGWPARLARNCLHIILATNNEWVAPVEIGNRRFVTIETNSAYAQNAEHFGELYAEINGEGIRGFMHALLNRALPKRLRIPDSLIARYNEAEQLRHSWQYGNTFLAWLDERLGEGETLRRGEPGWLPRVSKEKLYEDYLDTTRESNRNSYAIGRSRFGAELRKTFPMIGETKLGTMVREWHWILPPLPAALDAMEKRVGLQGLYDRLRLLGDEPAVH